MFEGIKPLGHWPPKEEVRDCFPTSVTGMFEDAHAIIDASEIEIEQPQHTQCFPNYNTLKFLIGITPSGEIIFISRSFGCGTSDIDLTEKSGFLKSQCR